MTTANNKSSDESTTGVDVGEDVMSEVATQLGATPHKSETPKPAAGEGDETEETEEQKAERLANETPEEKEAREAAEAEEAAAAGGDEETEEQKAERLANETPEEKEAREAAEAEEAAAAEAAANDPAKADKAAAAKQLETALKDADPAVRAAAQGVIDSIIDTVVVKERAESTRLGARVTELTTELEAEQKKKGPTIVGGVNPSFMADDETAIDDREEQIEKFERWAARGIREGGVNLPDTDGHDPAKPSYTVEQIEGRLDEVLHEKKKILPAARANLQKRAQIDKALREIYPAVYDPKTPEYAQVQQVLKVLPELKQFADYRVIALKQILGDRALAELLKQRKEKKPTDKSPAKGATPPPKKSPPRAPGGGAPAKGGVLDPKSKQTAAPQAMQKVMKDPSDKGAFKSAVGALLTDL